MSIKVPKTKEEFEEMRRSLRQEISEDELDVVTGGNDHTKGDAGDPYWTCAWCGTTIKMNKEHDAAKHMAKCPKAPWLQ